MHKIRTTVASVAGAMLVVLPALVADRFCIAGSALSAARLRLAELRKVGGELEATLNLKVLEFRSRFRCGNDFFNVLTMLEDGPKKLKELRHQGAPASEIADVEKHIKDAKAYLQKFYDEILNRTDYGEASVDSLNEKITHLKQELADNHSAQELLEKQLGIEQ